MTGAKIAITGAAGFIGMHLTRHLSKHGYSVIGIDNLSPSYGSDLAHNRLSLLTKLNNFEFHNLDIANQVHFNDLKDALKEAEVVIHLAAWPGVRLSQKEPFKYAVSNLNGFNNILEVVNQLRPRKFMFASSSSIYGELAKFGPVRESAATGLNLKSFYAATKWSNELIALHYHHITNVPTIPLRFFTVFGEFGRPDMAYWNFLNNLLNHKTIKLYGETGGTRNFTYIDDIVNILGRLIDVEVLGFEPLNIATGAPITTRLFLDYLSTHTGITPSIEVRARPLFDVESTWADQTKLINLIGHLPETPISESTMRLVSWFAKFNSIEK